MHAIVDSVIYLTSIYKDHDLSRCSRFPFIKVLLSDEVTNHENVKQHRFTLSKRSFSKISDTQTPRFNDEYQNMNHVHPTTQKADFL